MQFLGSNLHTCSKFKAPQLQELHQITHVEHLSKKLHHLRQSGYLQSSTPGKTPARPCKEKSCELSRRLIVSAAFHRFGQGATCRYLELVDTLQKAVVLLGLQLKEVRT